MSFHSVGLAFSAEKHPQGHVIETIYDGQVADAAHWILKHAVSILRPHLFTEGAD